MLPNGSMDGMGHSLSERRKLQLHLSLSHVDPEGKANSVVPRQHSEIASSKMAATSSDACERFVD